MECPACHKETPSGQKFCGACGHKLELECPRCGATNPPQYNFCGRCGADLKFSPAIALATSGLITKVDPEALKYLGYGEDEILGKPFSLFVERDDLVVFFSHWNERLRGVEQQPFEIALKHQQGNSVYLMLEFSLDCCAKTDCKDVLVYLGEISASREISTQMQHKEDLVNLIFTATDTINTVSDKHLDRSIEDMLKKVCLYAEADRCFIYSISRKRRRLEPAYQWLRSESNPEAPPESKSIPLTMIKRAIIRLRQEKSYVVDNVAKLTPAERYELLAWHQVDLGAILSHLIYSGKSPIGIIGIAKNRADGEWAQDSIGLVKFMGQSVAERLPFARVPHIGSNRSQPPAPATESPQPAPRQEPKKVLDIKGIRSKSPTAPEEEPAGEAQNTPLTDFQGLPDLGRPMLVEALSGRKSVEQQPVFPRDDGLVLLTCPRCGLQESVSVDRFEKLGNAIHVTCSCRKTFSAVLEKRRAFRKVVRLDGHFTLKGDLGPVGADSSIWGPMVVNDLSKAGLRFSSKKAELAHPGDLLMVRFHLDNSNKALIHKPARVITVNRNEVGCRFEGDDSYDITLGFYFI